LHNHSMQRTALRTAAETHRNVKKKESKMGSNIEFVEFVVDQIANAGEITYKKMFGEYALYCDGKIMALICDNQLFIKPTKAGLVS
jgi:TfoX/Sxy family transcriptional regulator of competence genes